MSRTDYPLIMIGSGPGIGAKVSSLFAQRRYNKVALIARRATQLEKDKAAITAAAQQAGRTVEVRTYAVDVADTAALTAALGRIGVDLGTPETIFFNAARVRESSPLQLPAAAADLELDFRITTSPLLPAPSGGLPLRRLLARDRPAAAAAARRHRPSLLVTGSFLYKQVPPLPQYFVLSITKGAQRIMTQHLAAVCAGQGVHVGMLSVGGAVDEASETLSLGNISERAWELFEGDAFEVEIPG